MAWSLPWPLSPCTSGTSRICSTTASNLLFFLTPIIYTLGMIPVPLLRRAILLNPVTPLIELYRGVVLLGVVPPWPVWVAALAVTLVSVALGLVIFGRLRETLAESV